MLGAMGDGAPKIGRAAHDDAELEAAEARAEELKERFAFATDDRERQEALRLASEATMRVNTMRAACECPPSIARRAADEASRALKDARHMLEKAEEKQEPAAASPPKPDAAERRVRSPGVYERQSTASNRDAVAHETGFGADVDDLPATRADPDGTLVFVQRQLLAEDTRRPAVELDRARGAERVERRFLWSRPEIEESTKKNRPLARRRARRRRPPAARAARPRRARPRQGALRREARRREGEGKRGGRSGGRRSEARPERFGKRRDETGERVGSNRVGALARVSRVAFSSRGAVGSETRSPKPVVTG